LPLASVAAITGCDVLGFEPTDTYSGDPYPIAIDRSTGAILLGAKLGDGANQPAVLDVMSPLTVVDSGEGATPTRHLREVLLASRDGVPRARVEAEVISAHPCATPTCLVGHATQQIFSVVVGGDALSGDAARLDLSDDQMFLLPSIAGDTSARSATCDSVFSSAFAGGGTLVLDGAELAFAGVRPVVDGCLGPSTDPTATLPSGSDVMLVISTAVGPSVLSESAYNRYRDRLGGTVAALTDLPAASLQMIGNVVSGRMATVPNLALAGNEGSDPRGACRELATVNYLGSLGRTVDRNDLRAGSEGLCRADEICTAPSTVELLAAVDFLVIADTEPVLQALRAEIRRSRAEVDGILGTDALTTLELDLDYPNGRLLWRCDLDTTTCRGRPRLPEDDAAYQASRECPAFTVAAPRASSAAISDRPVEAVR
jgi:hypothetical protein